MLGGDRRSTRREALKRTGVVVSAAVIPPVLAACGEDRPRRRALGALRIASDRVVVADYGGSTGKVAQRIYLDPFTRETGVRVLVPAFDPAKYELMASRGRSQWDGAVTPPLFAVGMIEKGLLQRFPAAVPRSPVVAPAYRDYVTAGSTVSINQAYRTGTFAGGGPETWEDFWDLKRYPGKRALPAGPYTIEAALLADGVRPQDLYPLDFDRALAKLDQIRDQTLFVTTLAEGETYLRTGAASIVQLPNANLVALERRGVDVTLVWNEALYQGWTGATVPKGAPHADAMFALARYMMDPERQAQFAKETGQGPTNPKALDLLDDETVASLPNAPENLKIAVPIDPAKIAAQLPEYMDKLTGWLAAA